MGAGSKSSRCLVELGALPRRPWEGFPWGKSELSECLGNIYEPDRAET